MPATTSKQKTTPTDKPLDPFSPPDVVEAYIKKHYPTVAGLIKNDEIRRKLFEIAQGPQLADDEVAAVLKTTRYYQTHGPSSRALDLLLAADPASAVEKINQAEADVRDAFQKEGVSLDEATIGDYAKQLIRSGGLGDSLQSSHVDQTELGRFVGQKLRERVAGTGPGVPGVTADADGVLQRANQYLVPLGQADAENWALRIKEGSADTNTLDAYLRGLAKATFATQPDVLSALENGINPNTFYAPIRKTIANTLELDENAVQLTDPRWQKYIQVATDKGSRAPTLTEAARMARSEVEFKQTSAYKQQDASLGLGLAQFFGKIQGGGMNG